MFYVTIVWTSKSYCLSMPTINLKGVVNLVTKRSD